MILGLAALLSLAVGPVASAAPSGEVYAQLRLQQQIIVRVSPRGPGPAAPSGARPIEWNEARRGPRCVEGRQIAGATMMNQRSVDLVLRDNSRVRAHLERRCPALDYYLGFYVNATPDGRICADRDAIRSRAGGECVIEHFRNLRPEVRP